MIINTTILTPLSRFYVTKLIVAYLFKITLLKTILNQLNRIHVLAPFVLKIHLNITHTCRSRFYKWSLTFTCSDIPLCLSTYFFRLIILRMRHLTVE
jgi:hypothetical protein